MPRPDARHLLRAVIADLVVDIRCAERDGLSNYAAQNRALVRMLFRHRAHVQIDRCGWPTVPLHVLERAT